MISHLWVINFNVYNIPPYIISICWLLVGIGSHFFVHNLEVNKRKYKPVSCNNTDDNSKDLDSCYNSNLEILSFRELMLSPQFRIILLANILYTYSSAGFFTTYTPMVAKEVYNLPTYWPATLFSICRLTLVVMLILS